MRQFFTYASIACCFLFFSCESKSSPIAPSPSLSFVQKEQEPSSFVYEQETAVSVVQVDLNAQDLELLEKNYPQTAKKLQAQESLTLEDICALSKSGLKDSLIIQQIQETHSYFYLSTAEISFLKKSGVSQKVIEYMIQTGNA